MPRRRQASYRRHILAAIAEFERARTAERVRAGLARVPRFTETDFAPPYIVTSDLTGAGIDRYPSDEHDGTSVQTRATPSGRNWCIERVANG